MTVVVLEKNTLKKLAFATDDGETIHAHFGRARYYEIIELNKGEITSRNRVSKFSPHGNPGIGIHDHSSGPVDRHTAMFQPLTGADILVARGMGMGAIQNARNLGLEVILCHAKTITSAVQQYVQGQLVHNDRRVHLSHGDKH